MSNSNLVNYVKISPNSNNPRNNSIKKITIHHMAGNLSVEKCGELFSSASREASSNYGIDSDGRVGMYVEECNRSWASSSPLNDNQAITIEVANDICGGNWHVSDAAFDKLIDLCVDICQRNGIESLNFTGDSSGNLTMHRYFAATACPGDYLAGRFPDIADEVNRRLRGETSTDSSSNSSSDLYRVRSSWDDIAGQKGAFKEIDNAKKCAEKNAYNVYDANGNCIYPSDSAVTESTKEPDPAPQPEYNPDILVQVNIGGSSGWLGQMRGSQSDMSNEATGYAGVAGRTIEAVAIQLENAPFILKYAVHTIANGSLGTVSSDDYNLNDSTNGYAGIIGNEIDALIIWLEDTDEYDVEYQVQLLDGRRLSNVYGRNANWGDDIHGYAGIFGKQIERITARIIKK